VVAVGVGVAVGVVVGVGVDVGVDCEPLFEKYKYGFPEALALSTCCII
jgi:hypothetical protein